MIDILCTPTGASPIVIEALFPTSPERLFRAWTDPADLRQWFGRDPAHTSDVQIDLTEGGHWQISMVDGQNRLEGIYTSIKPHDFLSFTWAHIQIGDSGETRTPPSEVALEFTPKGAATRLVLTHREIQSESGRIGVRDGWRNSFQALYNSL